MSEYLSADRVARLVELLDIPQARLFDEPCPDVAATLREAWAIASEIAVANKPVKVEIFHWLTRQSTPMLRCPHCLNVWDEWQPEEHNGGCIGLRARRLVGEG